MRPDPPTPDQENPEQGRPSTTAPPHGGPDRTIVHLVRHGEVHNPGGILYGRLPEYHLSENGREMAVLVAQALADHDVVHLRCSPLERARETMEPIAADRDAHVVIDGRVIEADNYVEGQRVRFPQALRNPRNLWHLRNPLRPSWGESYTEIVARMRLAIADAAAESQGHEAVIVSHQLPIWMARCDVEGRRLVHDPRRRECALASVTSLTLIDSRVTSVVYSEPAAALIAATGSKKFVAGA
ncbi:MAG: histidine phosphatase family protein [Microlunatus sp.]|nr:histidine phosphatase family protein [Microlunatus sp.]